ncbi:hypothetical protein [Kitasatospora sp. NPDC047058]|uniref:hypothetical protein n=1 Tax=Kitasatospora sp. NPDC047058 TaxID=3155620 RepID=UPI0033C2C0A5
MIDALPGRDTAMAPHHYTLHAATPAGPAGPPPWQQLPVAAEGTGRDPGTAARLPGLA